ncbi:MAG: TerB family tellurite resistance protein [Rhizobiales bacterium]|nr:TerB family tellurite resistance protein [Hyphomicrobiales bacterium]
MISALKRFLADLGSDPDPEPMSADEGRLAAAALLFHVMAIDGSIEDEERSRLRALLRTRFSLDDAGLDALMEAAETADRQAVDLYGFTSVLKRRLDIAERERIVGMMWEMVYADGKLHEFEDNLIWRTAELLGVSSEVRIRLKQLARDHGGA